MTEHEKNDLLKEIHRLEAQSAEIFLSKKGGQAFSVHNKLQRLIKKYEKETGEKYGNKNRL